jgi:large subunit ribosomal protein L1
MGKIRTRILGLEEVEKKQKEEQKKRTEEKKKVRAPGLKGGERMVAVEVKEEELVKLEKAKKILEEKPKKEEKKEEKTAAPVRKKGRGKKYQVLKKMLDKNKTYSIKEAVSLMKKMNQFGFDQTVELHLNVDKTGLKGEVELPYSTGKTVRVAIVDDQVLVQIEKGEINFDVLIAHPSYMPKLARFARILGPKGLMPNPKAGTISDKPEEVAKKFEKGLLRWKTEPKFPLIHQAVGKLSLDEEKLVANGLAFLKSVGRKHIRTAFVKATMTPSLKLSLEELK